MNMYPLVILFRREASGIGYEVFDKLSQSSLSRRFYNILTLSCMVIF